MDWGWSPWKRVEARVVVVAVVPVRVRVVRKPRPKLGLRDPVLRTLPWKRRNKVGAHPVQPYLPQKWHQLEFILGPFPTVHERLPSPMLHLVELRCGWTNQ
jgi:hypothetical protein